MAVEKGRKVKKDMKMGICGEHGGDPASVKFCHRVGLTYVSCSPFRVPIARLSRCPSRHRRAKPKAPPTPSKVTVVFFVIPRGHWRGTQE